MTDKRYYLSAAIAIIIILALFDGIWLGLIQKNAWFQQVQKIQGSPPQFNIYSAIVTYLIMAGVILALAVSRVRKDYIISDSLLWGSLVGLAMYGVFNGTNYTIFKDYCLYTACTDTFWGIFLGIITTMTSAWCMYNIKTY